MFKHSQIICAALLCCFALLSFTLHAAIPDAPTITPNGGTFNGKAEITIASASADFIYYTLDGTDPITDSILYTGPFNLKTTATVKAVGINADGASAISSAAFTIKTIVTVTGMRVADKAYDGTSVANVFYWGDIIDENENVVAGLTLVTTNASVNYASAEIGSAIPVTATGLTLAGIGAENYNFDGTASCFGNIVELGTDVVISNATIPPTNATEALAKAGKLTVKWTLPEEIDDFIIEYSTDLSFNKTITVSGTDSITVENLLPLTTYNFRVNYNDKLSNTIQATTDYFSTLNEKKYPMMKWEPSTRFTLNQFTTDSANSGFITDADFNSTRDFRAENNAIWARNFEASSFDVIGNAANTFKFTVNDRADNQYTKVDLWIDLDRNGTFNEGEHYVAKRQSTVTTPNNVLSIPINLPAEIPYGTLLMARARVSSDTSASPDAFGFENTEAGMFWDIPLLVKAPTGSYFTVTLNAGANGSFVDHAGNKITTLNVLSGSATDIIIQADTGYSLENVRINNLQAAIRYNFTLSNVQGPQTIGATFTNFPSIFIEVEDGSAITSKEVYKNCNVRIEQNIKTPAGADTIKRNTAFCEIKGRGNSTWSYAKKPYRLKFAKADKATMDLFGMGASRNWVLLANYIDPSGLRNDLAFKMGREMGVPFTHGTQHVRLVLNGKFDGLYQLTEQSEVAKTRVDINELDPDVDEGVVDWLAEFDTYRDEYIFTTPTYKKPMKFKQPEILGASAYFTTPPSPTGDAYNTVATYKNWKAATDQITKFEADLKANLTKPERPDLGYENNINDDTFIDWLLVHMLAGNYEPKHPKSTYFHANSRAKSSDKIHNNGKISAGVLWDFDWAYGYTNNPGTVKNLSEITNSMWFGDLFQYPKFTARFKARWADVKANLIDNNKLYNYIDETASFIAVEQAKDHTRWGESTTPEKETAALKTWFENNVTEIDNTLQAMVVTTQNITYNATQNGTLSGPASAVIGDDVTLSITPSTNYKPGTITMNGTPIPPQNEVYKFRMPNAAVTINAEFVALQNYTLSIYNALGDSGAIKETTVVNITPDTTPNFKYWTAEGIILTSDSKIATNLSFVMPANDVKIFATFIPEVTDFKVEPASKEGITISFVGKPGINYILLRSETENFAKSTEINIGTNTNYLDYTGVVPGKTYYYKIRGYTAP